MHNDVCIEGALREICILVKGRYGSLRVTNEDEEEEAVICHTVYTIAQCDYFF